MTTIKIKYGLIILFSLLVCNANAQVSFTIPANPAAGNITSIEYFIDSDPGFGSGNNSITFTPSADITVINTPISLTGLSNGVHRLYMRSKNVNGGWSHTNINTFFIVNLTTVFPANTPLSNISKIEYFVLESNLLEYFHQ